MLGSTTSFRQWSVQIQRFVTRQFDCLLSYLGEMDVFSRLIVLLAVVVFCHFALQGYGRRSA
jgi:hypothetical protein